jgi:hypothetical protein
LASREDGLKPSEKAAWGKIRQELYDKDYTKRPNEGELSIFCAKMYVKYWFECRSARMGVIRSWVEQELENMERLGWRNYK